MEELWGRVTSTQPVPETLTVALIALAAMVVVTLPATYRLIRHVVTVVHEAGHALVAVLVGRRLSGIRLHSDTSGVTVSRGKPRGLGMILTLLAGYPAPGFVGLGAAWVLGMGYAYGLLVGLVVLCAVLVLFVRNFYGLVVLLVLGGGVAAAGWYATPEALSIGGYAFVWLMLLSAPRSVVELGRSRGRGGRSDADQLAGLTRLPAWLWIGFFWLITVGCLVLGGWLMLRPV